VLGDNTDGGNGHAVGEPVKVWWSLDFSWTPLHYLYSPRKKAEEHSTLCIFS